MAETYSTPAHLAQNDEEHGLNSLGMWVFLANEVMFFGALFAGYLIYRYYYPQAFAEGSRQLSLVSGGINTALLLTSSFTAALAVHAAQMAQRRALVFFLLATILLGAGFLGVKGVEYWLEFQEGLYPAQGFRYTSPGQEPLKLFFSLYFIMTGLHAAHMLIGLSALAALTILAWRGRFTDGRYAPVELAALFWHFVDVVWIFLFPLLYLIDRTP